MPTKAHVTYRVEMFTRTGVYVAGERLTLEDAERLALQEHTRSDRWGQVRIVLVTSRTLRVLRDIEGSPNVAGVLGHPGRIPGTF